MSHQFQQVSERRTPPRGQLPALERLLNVIKERGFKEGVEPRSEAPLIWGGRADLAPGAEEQTRRRLEMGEPKDKILRRIQELLMEEDSVFQRHGKAMERGLMTRDPEGRVKGRKVTPETFMPNLRRWWGYPYNEGGYL